MSIICEFCQKIFSTKTNLNTHQKKAKFCLEKRGIRPQLVFCEFCNLGFLTNRQMKNHVLKCASKIINREEKEKIEKDNEISSLKELCKNLISSLEKVAIAGVNKPTKTINIIKNLNLQPLTKECFTNGAKLLKRSDIENGCQSISDFLCEKILKDKVICSDTSRNTFRFMNEDGKMIIDKNGKMEIINLFCSIKEPCILILEELENKVFDNPEETLYNLKNIHYIRTGLESICKGETTHDLFKDIGNKMAKQLPYLSFKI